MIIAAKQDRITDKGIELSPTNGGTPVWFPRRGVKVLGGGQFEVSDWAVGLKENEGTNVRLHFGNRNGNGAGDAIVAAVKAQSTDPELAERLTKIELTLDRLGAAVLTLVELLRPEQPASKPEQPASKPEQPASKPEQPASKPEQPATEPVDGVARILDMVQLPEVQLPEQPAPASSPQQQTGNPIADMLARMKANM